MRIELPKNVQIIIETLQKKGFEAFVVGGCIRDSILGLAAHDWDICTDATPDKIGACFKDYLVIDTGLKHGTVTVAIDHEHYEITTYRVDGEYKDNRRPETVRFVKCLQQDLARRDFTINAMAYNEQTGIQDYFNGIEDLKNGIVRCVGDANQRFSEDALRMMRALRFSSVFDFPIAPDTAQSIHQNRALLKNIAAERINVELCKLICGKGAKRVLLEYNDVMKVIIPQLEPMMGFLQHNPYHYLDVWQHTVETIEHSPMDIVVRLTMLLHDIGKPMTYSEDERGGHFYGHYEVSFEIAKVVMRNLKFDNDTRHEVTQLIRYHDTVLLTQEKYAKRWLNKLGEKQVRRLIAVKRADTMGQIEHIRKERLEQIDRFETSINAVLADNQCYSLGMLCINGHDVIECGIPKGPQVGKVLADIMQQVLDGTLENDREVLLEWVRQRHSQPFQ